MTVGDIAQPVENSLIVEAHEPLLDVVKQLDQRQLSTLTVIGEGGSVVGLLEKSSITELLQNRQQQSQPEFTA
jgi:predicted transcriptional regulator